MPPRKRSSLPAWQELKRHHREMSGVHMRELFKEDPGRAKNFSLETDDVYVDFSRHRITSRTLDLLVALAGETDIEGAVTQMYDGACVNRTEQCPALHTALRLPERRRLVIEGRDIPSEVRRELERMENFVSTLRAGKLTGWTGKPIDTLVNIGIGGSDLGPRLVTEALEHYRAQAPGVHFVANVDADEIESVLRVSSPETTLFAVSSKSFATRETLRNAATAGKWLVERGCRDVSKHFIALTANPAAAVEFGIGNEHIFKFWEWVGGRYSVWSVIGLPVAASIGMVNFREFLGGAHRMDEHFKSQPLRRNLPVILGLLDIWNLNFFKAAALAVIPYARSLKLLPDYIGQLMMESNGKSLTLAGAKVGYETSAVVWGGTGTNVQHAFLQLLHQGTRLIPVDFLAPLSGRDGEEEHHRLLLANCIAQSRALMAGNADSGKEKIPRYRVVAGNKPSTTILFRKLTPRVLGALLALYEHRTFVQGHLWGINPFDQWGVELGKTLAVGIADDLAGTQTIGDYDASTAELIRRYRESGGEGE